MNPFVNSAATFDLTAREILMDLPQDAGAVVVLLLLGGFIFFTWFGSRRSTIAKYRAEARSVAEIESRSELDARAVQQHALPPTMTAPARPARRGSPRSESSPSPAVELSTPGSYASSSAPAERADHA